MIGRGNAEKTLTGGDVGTHFVTSPVAGTRRPIRIWIIGDSGTGDKNAAAVRDAYAKLTCQGHTDLRLMLGDNAYPRGTDSEASGCGLRHVPGTAEKIGRLGPRWGIMTQCPRCPPPATTKALAGQ